MESLLATIAALVSTTLAGTFSFWQGSHQYSTYENDVEYDCAPFVWVKEPKMEDGVLKAQISAECTFKGNHGGGFVQLNKGLMERVVREAHKVHRGPVPETYKGLPSNLYDATYLFKSGDDQGEVRNDIHVASNEKDKAIFDTISTGVKGTGNYKYLKKIAVTSEVTNADKEGLYRVRLGSYAEASKPWYVPGGIFASEIRKAIEKQVPKTEKELITELANNL